MKAKNETKLFADEMINKLIQSSNLKFKKNKNHNSAPSLHIHPKTQNLYFSANYNSSFLHQFCYIRKEPSHFKKTKKNNVQFIVPAPSIDFSTFFPLQPITELLNSDCNEIKKIEKIENPKYFPSKYQQNIEGKNNIPSFIISSLTFLRSKYENEDHHDDDDDKGVKEKFLEFKSLTIEDWTILWKSEKLFDHKNINYDFVLHLLLYSHSSILADFYLRELIIHFISINEFQQNENSLFSCHLILKILISSMKLSSFFCYQSSDEYNDYIDKFRAKLKKKSVSENTIDYFENEMNMFYFDNSNVN